MKRFAVLAIALAIVASLALGRAFGDSFSFPLPLASKFVLGDATTSASPSAGTVGETKRGSSTATSLTSGTAANLTSVSLTAGHWDCNAEFSIVSSANTMQTGQGSIGTTSASIQTQGALGFTNTGNATNNVHGLAFMYFDFSTTTTVYFVGEASVTSGTPTGQVWYQCRRAW